jgi:hypothetical protein
MPLDRQKWKRDMHAFHYSASASQMIAQMRGAKEAAEAAKRWAEARGCLVFMDEIICAEKPAK